MFVEHLNSLKKPLKCTPQIGKFYDYSSFKGWNFIPTVMTSKKGLVLLGDVGRGCHICAGSCTDKGWLGTVQKVKVLTEATCSGKKPGRRDFGCDVVATCPLM